MLGRQVVLPTPEFFPDPYDGSREAAAAIFDRVCRYMEVDRNRVALAWFVNERDTRPDIFREGRSDGAAGLYSADGLSRVAIEIDEAQLANPEAMVGTMAHELGHVHLLGDRRLSPDSPDHEPLTDLLTVLYGMGVFTANSVIRESHWTDGPASGWSVGRQGYLDGPDYGYAMALLTRARSESKPAWASHLRLDVRSAMKQGLRFLESAGASPFPGEAPSSFAAPADDMPWTRPKPAADDWEDEDDHLPPWASKKGR
ncbi:MAG: hypothetical protein K8U57_11855 [Planctomycetes bacterium]|nr:hypothetical protein [Planctomycetota bacterium]